MIDRLLSAQTEARAVDPVVAVPASPSAIDRVPGGQTTAPVFSAAVPFAAAPASPVEPEPAATAVSQRAPRRPLRRANLDALPPGIAARLAKLSGKAVATAPVAMDAAPVHLAAAEPDKTAAE